MSRLRAAVVGVGYLGRFHAEKYAAHEDVELVAVVDSDAARAHEVAEALGVEALVDHAALRGRVDCVTVAVPTAEHHRITRDLLCAGMDVLVEKPLSTSVAQGQDLLECAARGQRVLQVGHLERQATRGMIAESGGAYDQLFAVGEASTQPMAAPTVAAPSGQPTQISTQEEYQTLPSGAKYIAPDGSVRTKQ
jgi:predicted dinucleotide-utilizing enzyme